MTSPFVTGFAQMALIGGLMAGGAGTIYIVANHGPADRARVVAADCGQTPAAPLVLTPFDLTPTASPNLGVSSPPEGPAPARGTVQLIASTASTTVEPGAEFVVTISHRAADPIGGVEADVLFDPAVVQVVALDRAEAYRQRGAWLLYGVSDGKTGLQSLAATLAEANATGDLKNVTVVLIPGAAARAPLSAADVNALDPGTEPAFVVAMKAIGPVGSESELRLDRTEAIDVTGDSLAVTSTGSRVRIGTAPMTVTATPTAGAAATATESGTPTPGGRRTAVPAATCTPAPVASSTPVGAPTFTASTEPAMRTPTAKATVRPSPTATPAR